MRALYDNCIFNLLLLITILGEFILPWILKHFYKGYNSRMMVMSALGSPESPVRALYNVWLIWLGIFLLLTSVVLFHRIREISVLLAALIAVSIDIFAFGAGILSGLFSVNESKDVVTAASKIHGAGAAIGFMTLLFFPMLNGIAAFKGGDGIQSAVSMLSFVLATVCFAFFIMGDKEQFKNTVFSYEGLWERMTLFFMYVPFLYIAIQNLIAQA